jgi:uncharacterized protein (TIGR00299 family) protein
VSEVAWFHCFSGIAGDMAMGALVDAGADIAEVRAMCERLPVGGWALEAEPVTRCGIAGTKIHVHAEETTVVRTAAHVSALIEEARLPERVRRRALAAFHALARVEGRLHRRPPEQVHFHEVGAIDAIVDVVGTCAALELLDVDEVASSPVAQGIGMVRTAHGLLPNPAPAVTALLEGAPTYGLNVASELTTPTGAALLAALASEWGPLPPMTVTATGFGAGTVELDDRPNLVQVVVGDRRSALDPGQPVVLLETNVDDATGEQLAHAVSALLEAGAHDAWVTPILMKKGRPAHQVSALADPSLGEQVARVLARETGSLGVRGRTMERWPLARLTSQVDVDGYPVRVKVGAGRVKVEHDDAVRVARRTGRSLREVTSIAEERWRHRHDHDHDHGPHGSEPSGHRTASDDGPGGDLPGDDLPDDAS